MVDSGYFISVKKECLNVKHFQPSLQLRHCSVVPVQNKEITSHSQEEWPCKVGFGEYYEDLVSGRSEHVVSLHKSRVTMWLKYWKIIFTTKPLAFSFLNPPSLLGPCVGTSRQDLLSMSFCWFPPPFTVTLAWCWGNWQFKFGCADHSNLTLD